MFANGQDTIRQAMGQECSDFGAIGPGDGTSTLNAEYGEGAWHAASIGWVTPTPDDGGDDDSGSNTNHKSDKNGCGC